MEKAQSAPKCHLRDLGAGAGGDVGAAGAGARQADGDTVAGRSVEMDDPHGRGSAGTECSQDLVQTGQLVGGCAAPETNLASAVVEKQREPVSRIDVDLGQRRTPRASTSGANGGQTVGMLVLGVKREGLAEGTFAGPSEARVFRTRNPRQHDQTVRFGKRGVLERVSLFVDQVQATDDGHRGRVSFGHVDDQRRGQIAANAGGGNPGMSCRETGGDCIGIQNQEPIAQFRTRSGHDLVARHMRGRSDAYLAQRKSRRSDDVPNRPTAPVHDGP